MENLLKKLLKEKKEKELMKLNAIEIVNVLFKELQEREKDILSRRFALKDKDYQTLEEIGNLHNLTRERIRQIERSSLKKLKKIEELNEHLDVMRDLVSKLLEEHGGLMEKDFLLDILSVLFIKANGSTVGFDRKIYKNNLDFILSEILDDHIDRVDNSDKFAVSYKIKDQAIEYFEKMADELKDKIKDIKKTMHFEELVEVLRGLKSFSDYKNNLLNKTGKELDLKYIFKDEIFPEWADIINKNKSFYSFMQAVKGINPNIFGHWGSDDSAEIKPKRIADKIYLILKNEEKPMHFSKITEKINETGFDHKKVSQGSVHNELILDDRYILVDRGVYSLKDWGK